MNKHTARKVDIVLLILTSLILVVGIYIVKAAEFRNNF